MWAGNINDIEQVVIYINKELSNGRTLKDIEINDFKVNDRVMAKRLSRKGYKRINNQYILNEYEDSNTKVIKPENIKYDNSNTKVIKNEDEKYDNGNTEIIIEKNKKYEDSNTLVINQKEIQNKLIGLAQNYDKILNLIQEYDKKYDARYDKEQEGIVIELPIETKNDFRATVRINNVIWEQFGEFANNHKEFTKRDLLSMALKEYMGKYK
ncbi:hypothetical protein [Clostridium sp. HCS.1]|uniref:hypothetical protein n=1 Tax=Clostridium sp. HCS.1 TaxID=3238594 RepID=UPI003A1014E4